MGARRVLAPRRWTDDRGMVTAEFALALPVVVLVLAVALGAMGLVVDEVRCIDGARTGARALARGDSTDAARALTARVAPDGARIDVSITSGEAVVVVEAPRRRSPLPGLPVPRAEAIAPLEGA